MKKECAIVTGGTANDVAAMACLAINIKDTNPNIATEFVIFHDGIAIEDQKRIDSIFPTRFIYYTCPIDSNIFPDVVKTYFSTMIFCKYECFKLLNEYKTVIWTDYDVLIIKKIDEILVPTSSGFRMMRDKVLSVREMFNKYIKYIDMSQFNLDEKGICTPLFVLYDNMYDYEENYRFCVENTLTYADFLYLPEQCIINLLVQKKKILYENIDYTSYSTHPTELITDDTKILHAYGAIKFWSGLENVQWNKNYKEWKKLRGTSYSSPDKISIKMIKYIVPYGIIILLQNLKRKKHV